MKKITLIFAALVCGAFMANAQYTFTTIAGPVNVAEGSPVTQNMNDAGNSTGVTSGTYGIWTLTVDWANGFDAWSTEADATITTTAGSVTIDPPSTGGANNGDATTLTFSGALPGDYDPDVDGTLDLVFNQSWGGSNADWSNISLTIEAAPDPPACSVNPAPADGATDVNLDLNGPAILLTWEDAMTGGTPTSYELFFGTTSGSLTSLGTFGGTAVNVTGVDFGTEYFWQIIPSNTTAATGCDEWSFTTAAPPAAPSNDLCANAIPLTPGGLFTSFPVMGQTQYGSTDSGETPSPSCSIYDPVDPTGYGGDVWYSVVVPADGDLTIETQGDTVGNGGDSAMQIYSGACGALVAVDCDDDSSADGLYSLVNISDINLANETLYIRVFEYQGDDSMSFQISAYNATLSINDQEFNTNLKYYPNPVTNILNLDAQQNVEQISVFNIAGQRVLEATPSATSVDLDMSELQTGAYFVRVQMANGSKTIKVMKQ
ncbi:MAG: T9SS type A sorting domain-containing protein [bacterium]